MALGFSRPPGVGAMTAVGGGQETAAVENPQPSPANQTLIGLLYVCIQAYMAYRLYMLR